MCVSVYVHIIFFCCWVSLCFLSIWVHFIQIYSWNIPKCETVSMHRIIVEIRSVDSWYSSRAHCSEMITDFCPLALHLSLSLSLFLMGINTSVRWFKKKPYFRSILSVCCSFFELKQKFIYSKSKIKNCLFKKSKMKLEFIPDLKKWKRFDAVLWVLCSFQKGFLDTYKYMYSIE